MVGDYDGMTLVATGTCLAPYIGNVDVDLTGWISSGRWQGHIVLSTAHPQTQMVMFDWRSPLLGGGDADRLSGEVLGISQVDPAPPSGLTLVQPFKEEIGLLGAWAGGDRPLMNRASFLNWLSATAAAANNSGSQVFSVPLTSTTCNQTLEVELATTGGTP